MTTRMDEQMALGLIARLLGALHEAKVDYCHWKSTDALARSATGDNDLDLLVDRGSVQKFTEILWRLGFKEAELPQGRRVPGIRDFYGWDPGAARLIHVHAHYQLVLGHDTTKNYRLPVEQAYLASSTQGELFRVPAPAFEFVVLVIRMALKHLTWDAVLLGRGSLSAKEHQEVAYLAARAGKAEVQRILAEHLPYVDEAVFKACLAALEPGRSPWARVGAGRKLHNSLASCARRPAVVDGLLRPWRTFAWTVERRVRRHAPRRRLAAGGKLIAVVGGDGSGKSTQTAALSRWLSQCFDVTQIHLGKPRWSALTIAVRGVLKLGRMLGLYGFVERPEEEAPSPGRPAAALYGGMLRAVCTARDRYHQYLRARRLAGNGGLVICDRYPLPGIIAMDGPQVARSAGARRDSRLIDRLATLEERYYRGIALPDMLVVLRVNPDVCVARKTDETAESVRARSSQVWECDWRQTPAHVLDGGKSQAEVFVELQAVVWSQL